MNLGCNGDDYHIGSGTITLKFTNLFLAFVLSSALAGIAGGIHALFVSTSRAPAEISLPRKRRTPGPMGIPCSWRRRELTRATLAFTKNCPTIR